MSELFSSLVSLRILGESSVGNFGKDSFAYGNLILLYSVLFVLVMGVLWWVVRGGGLKGKTGKGLEKINLESVRPLGNRQYLFLVSVSGEKVLLSSGSDGVRFLTKIRNSSEPESNFQDALEQEGGASE